MRGYRVWGLYSINTASIMLGMECKELLRSADFKLFYKCGAGPFLTHVRKDDVYLTLVNEEVVQL